MSLTLPIDSIELSAFHRLFDAQVARTPNRTAIFFEEESWTYLQLSQYAHAIAWELLRSRVGEEECIGICVDRRPGAIAAMLGIMRAGGAFVPLDPELPLDRIQFMIENAGIKKIICDQYYADLVAGFGSIEWMTLESIRTRVIASSSEIAEELPGIRSDQ